MKRSYPFGEVTVPDPLLFALPLGHETIVDWFDNTDSSGSRELNDLDSKITRYMATFS